MNHAEQSNEDIQREAQRLQGRSNARRRTQRKDKAYKKASRGLLAGAAIAATIAGGSYAANKSESSPAPDEPTAEKPAGDPRPESPEANTAERVSVPVTSIEGGVDQPIAVNQVVEFDAEGQPVVSEPEPSGGVAPEPDQDVPDSRSGGTPAP